MTGRTCISLWLSHMIYGMYLTSIWIGWSRSILHGVCIWYRYYCASALLSRIYYCIWYLVTTLIVRIAHMHFITLLSAKLSTIAAIHIPHGAYHSCELSLCCNTILSTHDLSSILIPVTPFLMLQHASVLRSFPGYYAHAGASQDSHDSAYIGSRIILSRRGHDGSSHQ